MAARSNALLSVLAIFVTLLMSGCPVALAPIDETEFACVDDSQCGTGHTCEDNRCVRDGADAGVVALDAAQPDTAATDGAAADAAAADAAAADAAAADAATDDGATDDGATDAAMPDSAMPDSAGRDAGTARVEGDLVVLFTFDEGQGDQVLDVSGSGTAADLTIADTAGVTWVSGGLEINAGSTQTFARSSGGPQALIESCQASDALTVEAWITPAQLTDDGPGRIVTCSANASNRNFTLGQGSGGLEDVWTTRVRTDLGPDQGTNNGIPNIWTRPGTTTTALTHLVFTHSEASGVVRFYMDGVELDLDREGAAGVYLFGMPRSGGYSNWNSGYRLGLGGELDSAGGTRAWAGVYHLVAIYCRDLSADEVAQNFAAGPG